MPQQKIYKDNAEKMRAYRKRQPSNKQKQALDRLYSWKAKNTLKDHLAKQKRDREYQANKRQSREFIAIDGEGITRRGIHYYVMLSSSKNHTIENWIHGLSSKACFDFLLQYADQGILVGFYTSYDVNMMLKDLPIYALEILWESNSVIWEGYRIEWLPSKYLSISKNNQRITWFDVSGFFQKAFVKALVDWQIIEKDTPVYNMLVESKANRSTFSKSQKDQIKVYNLKECELLVEVMDKLRLACIDCGYLPASWHGAGALASVILRRNQIHTFNHQDESLDQKFKHAYYGGRNQVLLQGVFDTAYTHDINSAYPYATAMLPSARGIWKKQRNQFSKYPYSLYKLSWSIPSKYKITPFPFRHKGSIYWPYVGSGYYWQPEIDAAIKAGYSKYIKILERYDFYSESENLPFEFIHQLYEKRREYVEQGNDAQIVIKLGINALYGKLAQSIGWKGARPPFQNYFWSGFITSYTRSMIMRLASIDPESIIAFATDGVFSRTKLTEHSQTKQLGKWSVDEVSNLFMLQAGVYNYDKLDQATTYKSRGFNHKSVDYEEIKKQWIEEGVTGEYEYEETRFIGLGVALQHTPKLRDWRKWVTQSRSINFAIEGETSIEPSKVVRVYPARKIADESECYKGKEKWIADAASFNQDYEN